MLDNNQSKQKNIILLFLNFFFFNFQFFLRPVNNQGSNNVNDHKTDRKNGKGASMCGFHMYPKIFMKFLPILHGLLSGVHSSILCLKIFRLF